MRRVRRRGPESSPRETSVSRRRFPQTAAVGAAMAGVLGSPETAHAVSGTSYSI